LRITSNAHRIQNPLFGIPKEELFAQVDKFCAKEGFDDVALFRKGALAGQNAPSLNPTTS
jgi:hypothetical protein